MVNIEKELERLWEKDTQLLRASLFNLVFFSNTPKRTEYLRSVIPKIIAQFPCRIFFIEMIEGKNEYKVQVSKLLSKGPSKAACEQIEIIASPDQMGKISFSLLPNLLPDIPMHLFWGSDPTDQNLIFDDLVKIAKRVIFDSNCIDDLTAFSRRMLRLIEQHPQLNFVDLNWLLFHGWRQIFPQIFDSESSLEKLNVNSGLKIYYNTSDESWCKNNSIQALYLLLWLAGCCQWNLLKQEKKGSDLVLTFKHGHHVFEAILSPQERPEFNPRSILGIEISTEKDCFYLVSPLKELPKVAVHISTLNMCELPYNMPLPVLKKGFFSIRELFYSPQSHQYEKMLQQIAKIELRHD